MRDIIALNVSFLGTDSTCETAHHGTADCWFDAYSLCAKSIVSENLGWWDFTSCLYSKQDLLCPVSWDNSTQECGAEPYDATVFATVVDACASSASFTDEQQAEVDACAVDADGTMASQGAALVTADMVYSTAKNGGGRPTWIYVAGSLVDGGDYDDVDSWANAVSAAICAAYHGDSEACS